MKTRELPDEERRQHLTYEERVEVNKLLMKLWSEAAPAHGKLWKQFAPLAQRAFRIPPGPEGSDVQKCDGFEVGQEVKDGTGTSVIKKLRICGELREIFGLLQTDSHDHGLWWSLLGQLAQKP